MLPASSPCARTSGEAGLLIPVDSEHSALFQCAQLGAAESVVLTASGGRSAAARATSSATSPRRSARPSDVVDGREDHDRLGHPREQGPRGDRGALPLRPRLRPHRGGRASDVDRPRCRAVQRRRVDRASRLPRHARADLVRAHLSRPRTRRRCRRSISRPGRSSSSSRTSRRSRLLALARDAGERGGTYPCAFNAANEVAVEAFLDGPDRLPRHRRARRGRTRARRRRSRVATSTSCAKPIAAHASSWEPHGPDRRDRRPRRARDDPRGRSFLRRARRRDDAAQVLHRLRAADREARRAAASSTASARSRSAAT